jgi:hypothetical protein
VSGAPPAKSSHPRTAAGGAARGVVAAMAMTGMRRVTKGLGLVRQAPPERVAHKGFPRLFARVPRQHRDLTIELGHWAYGALAGAAYGAAPEAIRRRAWAGPAYGLAIWVVFESSVAPFLFGPGEPGRRPSAERVAVAADHLLYGAVLAARAR